MAPDKAVLLDTSTLSEVIKGRNQEVTRHAQQYLLRQDAFTFSILTRYEILRGLESKGARVQIARFHQRCASSHVLPISDEIVVLASQIYAHLHKTGTLISDADILIAATAIHHDLLLVTENTRHFARVPNLTIMSWREK